MGTGWIKIHRSMLTWEWYKNANTKALFLHLLLKAEPQDTSIEGVEVKRGQVLTSLRQLAKESGLSVRNIRTSIDHLKSTHEIAQKTTHRNAIITICNYDRYQEYTTTTRHNERHTERHSTDTVPTQSPIKEFKEIKEDIRKETKIKNINIFSFAKKRKILFEFSMTLLAEGRANALKEAEAAYDSNEATGWKTETRKPNGYVLMQDYSTNPLARLAGWQRKNQRTIPAADAKLWAECLKAVDALEVFDIVEKAPDLINQFQGIEMCYKEMPNAAEVIKLCFDTKKAWRTLLEAIKGEGGKVIREAIYTKLREKYPEMHCAEFYSKSPV